MAAWVFLFRAISAERAADADLSRLDALGEDLAEREELGVDLATDEGLDADLDDDFDDGVGADLDEDAGADLSEGLEVDEEESSACAPYLARQMSCLGARTPGVKDTCFLGSARGAKEARDTFPGSTLPSSSDLRTREQHRDAGSLPRFRPPGG